eukprot:s366_g53.t1
MLEEVSVADEQDKREDRGWPGQRRSPEELARLREELEMRELFGDDVVARAMGRKRQWCTEEGEEQQALIESILGGGAGGSAGSTDDSPGYEPSLADDTEQVNPDAEDDGGEPEDHESSEGDDDEPEEGSGEERRVTDFWEAPNLAAGTIRRVPHKVGVSPGRGNFCRKQKPSVNERNVRVRIHDDWRDAGEVNVGYGRWTGFTIFPLHNVDVNWDAWNSYDWGDQGSYEEDEDEEPKRRRESGEGSGGPGLVLEERVLIEQRALQPATMPPIPRLGQLWWRRPLRACGRSVSTACQHDTSGPRDRVKAKLHPNAKRNVDQVYKQVAKDAKKHRILVVDSDLKGLEDVVSSPFEAVDKMLPDRTICIEKRVVHDQRTVNKATSKFWHPPALQPLPSQVARRILWAKHRAPGLPVLMAKKDIAGAFGLLWVDPADVALFAGDLPWQPERAFGKSQPEEESLGLRRSITGRTDLTTQIVWGIILETHSERAVLPKRRIQKGAVLLAGPAFDYGHKNITLKEMQQFRGILTGWAAIVPGLCNELKAADKFLRGTDGSAAVTVNLKGDGSAEWETETAWQDVWELFEVCRWLSARTSQWELLFSTTLREMLPPLERLSLPQESGEAIFVSSDATTMVVGAIDWKHGRVFRETVAALKPWVWSVLTDEELAAEGDEIVV